MTQLAGALTVHGNTVRAHLRELTDARLVERATVPAGGRGRPAHRYRATAAGLAAVRAGGAAFQEYRGLTQAFAAHLARRSADPSGEARAIGREWGTHLARDGADRAAPAGSATERVVELLDQLGFTPVRQAGSIALRTCPLLELATEMPQVICSVHLGLVEGALSEYGAGGSAAELLPFVEPGACRLALSEPDDTARPVP